MHDRLVQHAPSTSAKDFLEALSPHNTFWGSGTWAFRGLARHDYPLTPSSYRPKEPWLRHLVNSGWSTGATPHLLSSAQKTGEQLLLKTFVDRADRCGLRIPDDSQLARRELNRRLGPKDHDDGAWPPTELLSHLALAQHYGVPTRLLDWTYESSIASYFAAQDPAELQGATHLAVWALNLRAIDELWGEKGNRAQENAITEPKFSAEQVSRFTQAIRDNYHDAYALNSAGGPQTTVYRSANPRVEVVSAPYEAIPNLAAQRGLFTVDRAVPNVPLDVAIVERHRLLGSRFLGHALVLFTLPRSEASELTRRLRVDGVSAATIYPGYDGVVRSMREAM